MTAGLDKSRGSRLWIVLAVFGFFVLLFVAVWQVDSRRRARSSAQAAQSWITPEIRVMKTQVNATGVVRLKTGAEVRVGAQLSGIVRRLFVTVGSSVRKGQIIAEIDADPIQARIQQSRAQLAQARVSLVKARIDADRSRQLFDAGIISKQQFQDSSAALDAANASVGTAQSNVNDASVDLSYADIRAPISGTIASVSTQQGETVAATFATPTFVTIIQREALEVAAMVDEADIGNVRPGEEAEFTTETWPDIEFSGTVLRIAPVATVISGVVNYEVAISISQDLARLKPDMTANVNILTAQHRATILPAVCVRRDEKGSFVVLRSASGQLVRQPVTVGGRSGNGVEILRGLDAGARVLQSSENAKVK